MNKIPQQKRINFAKVAIASIFLMGLMSLKSGDQVKTYTERERVIMETDTIQHKVKRVNNEIRVIDDQLKYKDSIDRLNQDSSLKNK